MDRGDRASDPRKEAGDRGRLPSGGRGGFTRTASRSDRAQRCPCGSCIFRRTGGEAAGAGFEVVEGGIEAVKGGIEAVEKGIEAAEEGIEALEGGIEAVERGIEAQMQLRKFFSFFSSPPPPPPPAAVGGSIF